MTDAVDRVAAELERRNVAAPARLLIDAHRPLAPLLSNLAAALGPLAGAAFGPSTAQHLDALLDGEEGLDRLVDRLDTNRSRGEADAEPG